MSTARAILMGQLVVNVPVYALIAIGGVLGFRSNGITGLGVGVVLGTIPAWLWWSFAVPRWRAWALAGGAEPERLQRVAMMTGLVWPKGWIFEKTELPPRNRGAA